MNRVANGRLVNQQIIRSRFTRPGELIKWMGAVQAQDYEMAKWAVGLRLKKSSGESIDKALNNGEILRTHLLRPTWHFISPDDIHWMLELTAPHIKRVLSHRKRRLEITPEILKKSHQILEVELSARNNLSRADLFRIYAENGIRTDENRLSHILLEAELDGIICSGKIVKGKNTYSLLSKRYPGGKLYSRDESVSLLAERYFRSHSPATLKDFSWWSGLPFADVRRVPDLLGKSFHYEEIESIKYLVPESWSAPSLKFNIRFLPAYDEFLIAYRDRSASISFGENDRLISRNGIFYPVIVINGLVTGLWKRITIKKKPQIEIAPFHVLDDEVLKLIEEKSEEVIKFYYKSSVEKG